MEVSPEIYVSLTVQSWSSEQPGMILVSLGV